MKNEKTIIIVLYFLNNWSYILFLFNMEEFQTLIWIVLWSDKILKFTFIHFINFKFLLLWRHRAKCFLLFDWFSSENVAFRFLHYKMNWVYNMHPLTALHSWICRFHLPWIEQFLCFINNLIRVYICCFVLICFLHPELTLIARRWFAYFITEIADHFKSIFPFF